VSVNRTAQNGNTNLLKKEVFLVLLYRKLRLRGEDRLDTVSYKEALNYIRLETRRLQKEFPGYMHGVNPHAKTWEPDPDQWEISQSPDGRVRSICRYTFNAGTIVVYADRIRRILQNHETEPEPV